MSKVDLKSGSIALESLSKETTAKCKSKLQTKYHNLAVTFS